MVEYSLVETVAEKLIRLIRNIIMLLRQRSCSDTELITLLGERGFTQTEVEQAIQLMINRGKYLRGDYCQCTLLND